MRILFSIIVATSLGVWSLSSVAQESVTPDSQGYSDSGVEGAQYAVLDAVYREESRIVIDDREYFLEGSVTVNNQVISAGSALAILREGQRLLNVVAEYKGDDGRLVLQGVDTF
ncbi:hypothetical protein [Marinobacter sp. F3R11]|uniref:hypothetical protein n=1 Tax=Marinobacter sp. F3R11 TaxID=2267231 RepID=UPI000DE8961D|nr:hypothetical protein [Marinobacter sp. F3R11]RBW48203.1 hypothetical protein DS878_15195 [Marinobacter sp. F3R11]